MKVPICSIHHKYKDRRRSVVIDKFFVRYYVVIESCHISCNVAMEDIRCLNAIRAYLDLRAFNLECGMGWRKTWAYLIEQNFVGQHFCRTKYFVWQNFRHWAKILTILSNFAWLLYWNIGQNFRRTKFLTPSQISTILSDKFLSNKVI